jgi:predicted nucleotidyltransferase
MKYQINQNEDSMIKKLQSNVYHINPFVYNWLKNYNDTFKMLLDPVNLDKLINIANLKELQKEYWVDIIRATLVLSGFGCKDVYVFGSVARAEADKDSDLDLAIEGCPVGKFLKMYGKVIDVIEHDINLINLDKKQDKFVKYLRDMKEGELIRVTKRRSEY